MQLAILGDKKSILAFSALGVKAFGVASEGDVDGAIEKIESGDFAVVFVTEETMAKFPKKIRPLMDNVSPAILVVPGLSGSTGEGEKSLKKIIERALGSDTIQIN